MTQDNSFTDEMKYCLGVCGSFLDRIAVCENCIALFFDEKKLQH